MSDQDSLNRDITKAIKKVEIKTGYSKANQSPYDYVEITLINEGTHRVFLNADSKFKWNDAIKKISD